MANSAPTIERESESKSFAKATTTEVKKGVSEMWRQLLGGSSESTSHTESGDKKLGGVVFERTKHETKSPERRKGAEIATQHIERIRRTNELAKTEVSQIANKMEQVLAEIRNLAATSTVLKMQFSEVTMQQRPKEVGKYHIGMMEMILDLVRSAKQNIESANAWINTSKKKGNDYWSMAKKHGETFTRGSEINSGANQVG